MIPGGGGSGQGPGRNSVRSTGTVPKSKSCNDTMTSFRQNQPLSRNMMAGRSPFAQTCSSANSQQKTSVMNVPKNQVPLSWSSPENSSSRLLHKNGPNNTSDPGVAESWDALGPGVPNNSFSLTTRSHVHTDSETNGYFEPASLPPFHRSRMNGHELPSTSHCPSQTNNETCRNEIHLGQCDQKKSNNIPRMNCSMDSPSCRSLQSPASVVHTQGIVAASNALTLNGQGDSKGSEFNNRNELKMKLEEEERKLYALHEKQSMLLRRQKQMLNSPFDGHRSEDNGQGDAHRGGSGPNDQNRSQTDRESHFQTKRRYRSAIKLRDVTSSEDSAVEDSYEEYMEAQTRAHVQGQIVRDKLAEINCLRAQLKQVKGLINMAQMSPGGGSVRSESSSAELGSLTDQAVNIRRQRCLQSNTNADDRSCQNSNDRGVANRRPDSKQSNASTKAEELEHEKARLRHLQSLIARVQEFHSSNLPIPEYLLAELKFETEEGSSRPSTTNSATDHRLPGERPVSPSPPTGEEFVTGCEDFENDGFEVPPPDMSEVTSQHACYPEEPSNGPSRRAKTVNVASDFDRDSDISLRGHLSMKQRQTEEAIKRAQVPSTTWENVTSSTPVSHEEIRETNEIDQPRPAASDHSCSCQHYQPLHQHPETQPQEFQEEENMEHRASQINQHSSAELPDVTLRGVWSSVPASEEVNSPNFPVDAGRYYNMRQENTAGQSSVNLFNHAQEVQNRLRALAQSYQGLLSDGLMEVLPGNRPDQIYTAMMSNLPPTLNFPPSPSAGTNSCDREHYYQQLFAASQLQYQQVLVTAVNQCFHLLSLQHQELASLRSTVHMLTSNAAQMSGIPQGQEPWGISPPSPAPVPPTLNNQVAPGNRTNNYWDNFRSYSRQNLLSAGQAKSNEVFAHNPSPLAERSHNALNQPGPSNPGPSAPVSHLSAASFNPASAMPMLSPLSGVAASALMETVGPTVSSATVPPPVMATQPAESFDADTNVPVTTESANTCRKDKRNVTHQGHQNQRNDCSEVNRPEVSSSGVCDVHPAFLSQENSPSDVEMPLPMPFLRGHLSAIDIICADSANRSVKTPRTRNHINSVPMTEAPPSHENNEGRGNYQRGSTWIGRQNWNNTSCFPNFQLDAHSAHSIRDFRLNNVSVPEMQSGTIKRNGCLQKRPGFAHVNQNYQRNISTTAQPQPYSSRNIQPDSSETKVSKNQPGFESSRNFLSNQRTDGQSRAFVPTRSEQSESAEQEEQPMRCNSGRHQNAAVSESDLQSESNKNHLKENRLQMNKSPKYQSKQASGSQTQSGNIRTVKSNHSSGSKRNQGTAKPSTPNPNSPKAMCEAVVAEMASYGYEPEFLTQFLRSMQLASADSRTENACHIQPNVDSQQNEEVIVPGLSAEPAPEEEERMSAKDKRRGRRTTPPEERQTNPCQSLYDRACSLPECETRGASSNDTSDKFKDLAVELSAYIRAHLHDTCSSAMIEEICSLVLMFIPFARNSSSRSNASQLEGLLENALHRFQGRRLEIVCDEMTSVILKVLTNELSFFNFIDTIDHNIHAAPTESNISIHELVPREWPFPDIVDLQPSSAAPAHSSSLRLMRGTTICKPLIKRLTLLPENEWITVPGVSLPPEPAPEEEEERMSAKDDVELLDIGLVSELASNGDLAEADQSHSSSLANGEVLNRSTVLRLEGGLEDEDLNAVGGEDNAVALPESRPLSCDPVKEHEQSADRRQSEAEASSGKENEVDDSNGAQATVSQEWEESSEEYQMAPQAIDQGLDQVPIRLGGDQHSTHNCQSSDAGSQ